MKKIDKDKVIQYASELKLNSIISPNKESTLNLYGSICKDLINNTNITKSFKSFRIYDSDPEKYMKKINGIEISSPENLKNDKDKIYITSAHSYDEILKNIIRIQKTDGYIINGLFV